MVEVELHTVSIRYGSGPDDTFIVAKHTLTGIIASFINKEDLDFYHTEGRALIPHYVITRISSGVKK